jgi:hypothetical protein
MPKRDARNLSHEASVQLRRTALRLVLSGVSQQNVASQLQVHPVTVYKWMAAYKERGAALFEGGIGPEQGARFPWGVPPSGVRCAARKEPPDDVRGLPDDPARVRPPLRR